MNDVSALAAETADALLDFCEELVLLPKQNDDDDRVPTRHRVYELMENLIRSQSHSDAGQALERQWHHFRVALSQHASLTPVISTGTALADWIKAEFDVENLLDAISKSRRSKVWSVVRSPSDWIRIFKALNEEISESSFLRARQRGEIRVKPGSTTRRISLRISDLPQSYHDDLSTAEIVTKSSESSSSRLPSKPDA